MGQYMDILGVKAVWPLVFLLSLFGALEMYVLKIKTEKSIEEGVLYTEAIDDV